MHCRRRQPGLAAAQGPNLLVAVKTQGIACKSHTACHKHTVSVSDENGKAKSRKRHLSIIFSPLCVSDFAITDLTQYPITYLLDFYAPLLDQLVRGEWGGVSENTTVCFRSDCHALSELHGLSHPTRLYIKVLTSTDTGTEHLARVGDCKHKGDDGQDRHFSAKRRCLDLRSRPVRLNWDRIIL